MLVCCSPASMLLRLVALTGVPSWAISPGASSWVIVPSPLSMSVSEVGADGSHAQVAVLLHQRVHRLSARSIVGDDLAALA